MESLFGVPWPPRCCVPAFVHAGLIQLTGTALDRALLTRQLQVTVRSTDDNPFRLPVAEGEPGAPVPAVFPLIAALAGRLDPRLSFRHIPLSSVTLELYDEVVTWVLDHNGVVGLGFDISGTENGTPVRHLVRLTGRSADDARLIGTVDDSAGVESIRPWDGLELASRRINDGFWILGDHQTTDPPWASSTASTRVRRPDPEELERAWAGGYCPVCRDTIPEGRRIGSGRRSDGGFCSLTCYTKYHGSSIVARRVGPPGRGAH